MRRSLSQVRRLIGEMPAVSGNPQTPEPAPDKKSRRSRFLRRLLILGAGIVAGCGLVFLTASLWIPPLAPWISRRQVGVEVSIGGLDLLPLGRIVLEKVEVRRPGAQTPAARIGRARLTYRKLRDLRFMHLSGIDLEGVDVDDAEIRALRAAVSAPAPSGRAKPEPRAAALPIAGTLPPWVPANARISGAKYRIGEGRAYGLRDLAATISPAPKGRTRIAVQLESDPLAAMMPLEIPEPLSLGAACVLGAGHFGIEGFKIGVGDLLRLETEKGEEAALGDSELAAFRLGKPSFDLGRWREILRLPLGENVRLEFGATEIRLGRADQASQRTGGLGPGALFSDVRFAPFFIQWPDFLPGWNAAGDCRLDLRAAVLPACGEGWLAFRSALNADLLESPELSLENLALVCDAELRGNRERIDWKAGLSFVAPPQVVWKQHGPELPQGTGFEIAGRAEGSARRAPFDVDARFSLEPRLDNPDGTSLSLPLSGAFRVASRGGQSGNRMEMAAEGEIGGGHLALSLRTAEDKSSATVAAVGLEGASIERLVENARLLGVAPPGLILEGELACAVRHDAAKLVVEKRELCIYLGQPFRGSLRIRQLSFADFLHCIE